MEKEKRNKRKKEYSSSESYGQMVWRRFRRHKLAMVSLVILILLGCMALFAPVIAPYAQNESAGSFGAAPSPDFWQVIWAVLWIWLLCVLRMLSCPFHTFCWYL